MKRIVGGLLVVAVSAALLVLYPTSRHGVPVVHAQSGCGVGTLTGNYGFIQPAGFTHTKPNGKGADVPWQFEGLSTFDGAGNASATYAGAINGQVFTNQTTAGTYTVNSDCTGSLAWTSGDAAGYTANFVIVDGGTEVFAVSTGSGDTASVILKKQ